MHVGNLTLKQLSTYNSVAKSARCVITTCLAASTLPPRHFDYCFIDEAGQATEPDILIPISRCVNLDRLTPQIVLAGDPKQLGPVVKSPYSRYFGLGVSFLDRLMSNDQHYQRNNN